MELETYPADKFHSVQNRIAEHQEVIERYADLLLWWNKKVNLVSRSIHRSELLQHIEHSCLLSEIECFGQYQHIIDIGTGGGLPGFPLALLYPEKTFILNDIVKKKVFTVKDIKRNIRQQNVKTSKSPFEELDYGGDSLIISKHAFKLEQLISFFEKQDGDTELLLLKGVPEQEKDWSDSYRKFVKKIYDLSKLGDFYSGKAIYHLKL